MQLWLHTPKTSSNASTNFPTSYKHHTSCFRLAQTRNFPKMLTILQLSSRETLNFTPFIFLDIFHMIHNLTKVPKQTSIIFPFHNFFMLTLWPKSQPKWYFLLKPSNCHKRLHNLHSIFPNLNPFTFRPQKPLPHLIYDLTKMIQYPFASLDP